jgi:hypothetical protein
MLFINTMLAAFTAFHVVLSLIGIGTGLVVLYGWLKAKSFELTATVFLWTTVATSVTGFLFPFHKLLPSHILGLLSLIFLATAIATRRNAAWRRTYLITATISLYLNFFVLIAQAFMKVPTLKALAPTQSEPPFAAAQLLALVLFAVAGFLAVRKFRLTLRVP